MDPRFDREWSAFEIQTVKSLILRHNNSNTCTNNMNKEHSDTVDELQAMFPLKEKGQVTNLYIGLMVEMMLSMQSGNQHVATSNNFMNDNFGTPMEDHAMEHTEMLYDSLMEDMGAIGNKVEAPQRQMTTRKQRQHTGRFWTIEEHRQFLYGLLAQGRGKWKIISRNFVPNKTPVQISSHAQKYFKRQENPNKKQRYSINDVGLYDAEPWVRNNASSQEGHSFNGGASNPNNYGSSNQRIGTDTISQVRSPLLHNIGQASSSEAATLATSHQQQVGIGSSSSAPPMQGLGSDLAWTSEQEDFLASEWFMNMLMN